MRFRAMETVAGMQVGGVLSLHVETQVSKKRRRKVFADKNFQAENMGRGGFLRTQAGQQNNNRQSGGRGTFRTAYQGGKSSSQTKRESASKKAGAHAQEVLLSRLFAASAGVMAFRADFFTGAAGSVMLLLRRCPAAGIDR